MAACGRRQRWLVITRDQNLRKKTVEIATILRCRAKVITIVNVRTPKGVEPPRLDVFRQLRVVLMHWDDIEGLLGLPGPFIYDVSLTGIHKIA